MRPRLLEGKAAVANARLAYELFENKFANDPRWAELEAKGAKKQRPLWDLHRHQERRLL